MLKHRVMQNRSSFLPRATILPKWVRNALVLLVAIAAWCSGGPAHSAPGDIGAKFQVNDNDPVGSLPSLAERNANPIEFAHYLQDLIARAEGNYRERKYAAAAKYYEALALAVPERALSFSRLCVSYGRLGKVELASANCGAAIRLQGAKVIDHVRFINLTLQKKDFSQKDAQEVEASLMHLRAHIAQNPQPTPSAAPEPAKAENAGKPLGEQGTPAAGASAEAKPPAAEVARGAEKSPERSKEEVTKEFVQTRMERMLREEDEREKAEAAIATPANAMHLPSQVEVLACKLASRLQDAERLGQCMQALRGFKVKEEALLPFEWSQALIQKDAARADALLREARTMGIAEKTLQAMATEQAKIFASERRLRWVLAGVAIVLTLGGVAVGLRSMGRRRKPIVPVEA